ncbi:MAG: YigZ family protein [Clostridia bacterium]|nr:YigZ family protein [Clostridia bacterium]
MDGLAEKYTTVKKEAHVEFEEKRSLFIGHATHVESEEEATAFIKAIKKEYSDATHNVWAYYMKGGILARYSDDGEPQGTAGMPVLEAIRKSGVDDICVVVTRYFGGILLGAGGLVRAYSHSAVIAIEGAEVVVYEPYLEYSLSCGYSEYQKYSNIMNVEKIIIDSTDFGAEVVVRFAVKKTQAESLLKRISEAGFGKDVPELLGERFDCR